MSAVADTKRRDLEDQVVILWQQLKACEWVYDTGLGVRMCPSCEGEHPDHEEQCELAAVVRIRLSQVQVNRVTSYSRCHGLLDTKPHALKIMDRQESGRPRQLSLLEPPARAMR